MRLLLSLSVIISLTGCAQVGRFFDERDPCQTREELGRPPGYQRPDWCGAGAGLFDPSYVITDADGRFLGRIYINTGAGRHWRDPLPEPKIERTWIEPETPPEPAWKNGYKFNDRLDSW